jgi:hypothetical protein
MSQVFYPFRAIGLYCDSIPFAIEKRGTETFVAASIEKTFQIYNVIFHSSIPNKATVQSIYSIKYFSTRQKRSVNFNKKKIE